MDTTRTAYARVYSETSSHLDAHLARVKEGRDVDAAVNFARWLFWSGIPDLLKSNATPPGTSPLLKCDGSFISWKLNELLQACNEYYRTGKPSGLHAAELESLRDKVDKLTKNVELMAGQLSALVTALASSAGTPPAVPRPPGFSRGAGAVGGCPSLSKCHNSIEDEKPLKIERFGESENEENPSGSYP